MSCSSIKHHFETIKNQGQVSFTEAMHLYNDLQGSLDAHRFELEEAQKANDQGRVSHLRQHIADGEGLLSEIGTMILH